MCYFDRSPLIAEHRCEIDDAIVAWKKLNVEYSGRLASPMQGHIWTPDKPMHSGRRPRNRDRFGIYAFKNKAHARHYSYGSALVKLLLWGTVLEYGGRARGTFVSKRHPGYMAQHAEIHEIEIPRAMLYRGLQDSLLEVWRDQGVRITLTRKAGGAEVLLAA